MSDQGFEEEEEVEDAQEDVVLNELLSQPEKADEFYTQLVTHDGLVTSWKGTLNRQRKLDKKMKQIEGHLNTMLAKFVHREEFFGEKEFVLAKITEFDQTISELVTLGQRLSSSEERHEVSIEDLKKRMITQEQFADVTSQELQAIEIRSSERYDKAVNQQETVCVGLQKQVDELAASNADLQVKEQECVQRDANLKAGLDTLNEFVMGEKLYNLVAKQLDDRCLDYINNERMVGEREKIVGMVEERLCVPIRQNIDATVEVIQKNKLDVEHKDEHLHRICTNIEHRLGEQKEQLIRTKAEIMDEVEVRAKLADFEEFQQKVTNMVTEARAETSGLKNKCVSKLNEFSDHFAKVHKTMRDHEHCLTHHAEEIENRATKYGVLTLQNRFDSYVPQQKYDSDQEDLKRTVEWQASQLEALCMGGMSMKSKASSKNQRSTAPPPQPTGDSSGDGTSRASEQEPQQGPNSGPTQGYGPGVVEEEDDDNSTVYVLQKQLELLAMGVLWLSHLALRQPELGRSRQCRLESEQDLLAHLTNVRHWITHRSAPGDWDPSALLSSALQFTHPKDDEKPGPLPIAKPPGSAGSFGRQKPDSAGSQYYSQHSATPRAGMKRDVSAPLQTVAGLLGTSASTQSLSAQSAPGLRRVPSQTYFNGSLPPSKASPITRRVPARALPIRKQNDAEDIGDIIMTSQGLNTILPVHDGLAPF